MSELIQQLLLLKANFMPNASEDKRKMLNWLPIANCTECAGKNLEAGRIKKWGEIL